MLATATNQILTVSSIILLIALAISAYTDIRWRIIPNWVTYPSILLGLGLNFFDMMSSGAWANQLGTVGFVDSIAGFLILFFGLLIIFSFSGGGAGDIKLVGAIGALMGVVYGAEAVCMSFVVCAALVLCGAVLQLGPVKTFLAPLRKLGHFMFFEYVQEPSEEQTDLLKSAIPLAPFFAVGVALVLLRNGIVTDPQPFQFLVF